MRQVAGQEMEELAAGQVRRAEHLAEVPHAAGLVLGLLDGEFLGAVREVAAEDDHVRPHVAHQVGVRLPAKTNGANGPASSGNAT